MNQIFDNNNILNNEEFLKDKYKFSLIGHNLGLEETIIYSDEENYIFVLGKKHKSIWLWTKSDISQEKIAEIKNILEIIELHEYSTFACKESLYKQLVFKSNDYSIEEVSGCYIYNTLNKPKESDGYLEKAKETDRNTITKMWYDTCVEANPDNHISYELAQKFVDRFLESDTFYVWKNNKGEIVSIIDYTKVDSYAEIAHAYTIPKERGKGYMANAVYQLTKIIIEKEMIPVLSTDYNYLPSNKCYQNIGYKLDDKIVVFSKNKILKDNKIKGKRN